jgi:hypothetical protein
LPPERPAWLAPTQKLILLWTTIFYENRLSDWYLSPETFSACPRKCLFTLDKSLFQLSDAVVYHGFPEGRNLILRNQYMYPLPRPRQRRADQIWVYFMLEPPLPRSLYDLYDTLPDHHDFNWTMSYRRDSDILLPYGHFIPAEGGSDERELAELLRLDRVRERTSLIAGMISECGRESGRDTYIAELQKYLPIDLYGKCGTLSCSRKENCYLKLARKYKFWLSFENSHCADYVSEKFYRPLKYGMVPVYFGHPDGPTSVRAPQGSFIHTKDFKDPQALATYLLYLDRHPEEYLKYFEWRRHTRVLVDNDIHQVSWPAWCDLCVRLHEVAEGIGQGQARPSKSYPRVADWFLRNNTNTSVCLKPSFNF